MYCSTSQSSVSELSHVLATTVNSRQSTNDSRPPGSPRLRKLRPDHRSSMVSRDSEWDRCVYRHVKHFPLLHSQALLDVTTGSNVDDRMAHLQWRLEEVRVIRSGTLGRLVAAMTCEPAGELDSTYVNTLLATYRTFTTAFSLLREIFTRCVCTHESFADGSFFGRCVLDYSTGASCTLLVSGPVRVGFRVMKPVPLPDRFIMVLVHAQFRALKCIILQAVQNCSLQSGRSSHLLFNRIANSWIYRVD